MVYTLRFFSLQNAVCFIVLTYLVPVLFTFYIQDVLTFKKNNSAVRRLISRKVVDETQINKSLRMESGLYSQPKLFAKRFAHRFM